MTDLWLEATHNKDEDRFKQALSAVTHRLASVTSALLDAESDAGFESRLAIVQPEVDKIISSATYSDPVLFARVQDDFLQRVEATWNAKRAWHKQAEADQWVQSQEMVNTYPGLKESLLFWTLEANGGDAAVYEAPGYTGGWRWMATGRDEVEGDGDAASLAEAQGKASEFLSTHSQIAGQIDMFARKTAFNVRKSNLIRQAGTQEEIDAWFDSNVLAEYVELLEPLKQYMVYGPNYKRGVREKIGDAMFALRQNYAPNRAYQESVLGALVGTVINGETWNYDGMEGVYRKTSSLKTASKDLESVARAFASYWGGEFTGIDRSPVSLIDGLWDGPWAVVKNGYGEWAKIKDISGEDSGRIENHRPNPDYVADPSDPYGWGEKTNGPPYLFDKVMRPAGTYAVVYSDREVNHINTVNGALVLETYRGDVPLGTTASKTSGLYPDENAEGVTTWADGYGVWHATADSAEEAAAAIQERNDFGDWQVEVKLVDGRHYVEASKKTANVDQITEGQWGCPGCDKVMSDNEKVRNIHVRYECPFRGQAPDAEVAPPTFYDADLERLLTEAAITVADNEVFSEHVTKGIYLTALRSEGLVHWAVSDESGEGVEEVESGSEQSIRDALEQARNTIDQVLQDSGGGSEAPAAPAEAPETAPVDPEAAPVDSEAPAAEEGTPETADPAAAPEEAPDVEGTTPPVEQVPDGEDAENPAAATEPLAEDAPASTDEGADQPSEDDDTATPDPGDNVPEELEQGEVPSDAEADEIVDSADATSEGEVTGLDPKSMQVGDRVNMTYTLTDGTVGDVEVTFVREDNDIFFFDGPNGEFGIGERDEDGGTVWVDSEGQHFAFADGDALEEVTGEEVPDEAVVTDVDVDDVDLDAPVGDAAPAEEAPPAEDAAPADDAPEDSEEAPEDGEDDDEDEFKKKFSSILTSMTQENPGVSYQVLRSLARRAAKLSVQIGNGF